MATSIWPNPTPFIRKVETKTNISLNAQEFDIFQIPAISGYQVSAVTLSLAGTGTTLNAKSDVFIDNDSPSGYAARIINLGSQAYSDWTLTCCILYTKI